MRGSIPLGRIVFTRNALPAIRAVNHVIEDGETIVRTRGASVLITQTATAQKLGAI